MFKNQLKFCRKTIGLTQSELAKQLGISRQAYQHYEIGDREPTLETLKRLCVIFDCTSDELLEIDTTTARSKVLINNSFNNSNNINLKL